MAQLRALTLGVCDTPVPLRLTVAVLPAEELLTMESCPLAAPAVDGVNPTVMLAVCPGVSVAGKLMPDRLNCAPVSVAELTVSVSVPVDFSVTVCVVVLFNATLPKLNLDVLNVSAGEMAFNCMENDILPPAVSFAVWALLTARTVAVKLALVDPAGTVTLAGTVTAALSLASEMLVAAVLLLLPSVTVQVSLPAPVNEVVAQRRPFTVGVTDLPVPARLTCNLLLLEALLVTVNVPLSSLLSEAGV